MSKNILRNSLLFAIICNGFLWTKFNLVESSDGVIRFPSRVFYGVIPQPRLPIIGEQTWNITIPENCSQLELFFVDFYLTPSTNCSKCYLQLTDMTSGVEVTPPLCGGIRDLDGFVSSSNVSSVPTLISDTNLQVKHVCNDGANGPDDRTFLLSYIFYPKEDLENSKVICNAALRNVSEGSWKIDILLSFRTNKPITCFWNFSAPTPEFSFQITFSSVNMPQSKNCAYEYFEIYDIHDESSSLIEKMCGYRLNKSIFSKSHEVKIILHQDGFLEQTNALHYGFSTDIVTVPFEIKRKIEGTFLLNDFVGNLTCTELTTPSFEIQQLKNEYIWEIRVNPGLIISIHWDYFFFSDPAYLSIYEDLTGEDSSFVLNKSCSNVLVTTGFTTRVRLVVDKSQYRFNMKYMSQESTNQGHGCNNRKYNLASSRLRPSGLNIVQNYPFDWASGDQNELNCVAKYKAVDKNNFLRIEINEINITFSRDCQDAGVIILDGDDLFTSKGYGPFCDLNKFPVGSFTSSGRYLTVVYYSTKRNVSRSSFIFNSEVREDVCQGIVLGDSISLINIWNSSLPACYILQHIAYLYKRYEDIHSPELQIELQDMNITAFLIIQIIGNSNLKCAYSSGRKNCIEYYGGSAYNCQYPNFEFIALNNIKNKFNLRFVSNCQASRVSFSSMLTAFNSVHQNREGLRCASHKDCSVNPIESFACGLIEVGSYLPCTYTFRKWDRSEIETKLYGDEYYHLVLEFGSLDTNFLDISELVYSSAGFPESKTHHHTIIKHCSFETMQTQTFRYRTITADEVRVNLKSPESKVDFLLLPSVSPTLNNSVCNNFANYQHYNGSCYGFFNHFVKEKYPPTFDVPVSWNDADRVCKEKGCDLVSILTEFENQFVLEMLRTHWMRQAYGESAYVAIFIGLKQSENGQFRWTDGHPLTTSSWYNPDHKAKMYNEKQLSGFDNDLLEVIFTDHQPLQGTLGQCTVMVVRNPFVGNSWATIPCKYPLTFPSYICKIKANATVASYSKMTNFKTKPQSRMVVEPPKCPPNWAFHLGKCYILVTSQGIITKPLRYTDAYEICNNYGGSLASVSNRNMSLIISLLNIWKHKANNGGHSDIWIKRDETLNSCQIIKSVVPLDDWQYLEDMLNLKYPSYDWKLEFEASCNGPINVLCETAAEEVIPKCSFRHFQCSDKSCISIGWVCDGEQDCPMGEDENDCKRKCRKQSYSCNNGGCIPMSQYCDFVRQCNDGSDEDKCIYPNCTDDEFRCGNGRCIPFNKTCDFVFDCDNSADESQELCDWKHKCEQLRGFQCYNGQCLPIKAKQDMKIDCIGRTQEDEHYIETDYRRGLTLITPGGYLNESNEYPEYLPYCVNNGALKERCYINHPSCFNRHQACILDMDSDQNILGCVDMSHIQNCKDFECTGNFKCPGSFCVPLHRVCNGIEECPYGEDELGCHNYSCPGNCHCKGETFCIKQSQLCDGVVDCKQFQEDEMFCDIKQPCPPSCECSGYVMNCSYAGLKDLPDASSLMRSIVFSNNYLNLTEETFKKHFYVGYLDLSYNGVRELLQNTFADMANLLDLILVGNKITLLDNVPFFNVRLNLLDLRENSLEHISNTTFQKMRSVAILDLRNNSKYMIIAKGAFDGASIKMIRTDGHRFCCSASGIECTPEPDEFFSCSDLMANHVLKICIWVLGITACVGNVFVFIWKVKYDKAETIFIINLSLCDFLMGVYLLIIAGADAYYAIDGKYYLHDLLWRDSVGCQIAGFLSILSSEMSVFTLVMITVDRVIVTLFTFNSRIRPMTKRQAIVVEGIAWLVWIMVSAAPFLVKNYIDQRGQYYGRSPVCLPLIALSLYTNTGAEYYGIVVFVVFNSVSLLVIFIGYVAVACNVDKARKSTDREGHCGLTLIRSVTFVVATDLLCCVLIVIASALVITGVAVSHEFPAAWVAVFILPIKSTLNPILYILIEIVLRCDCKAHSDRNEIQTNWVMDRNPNERQEEASQSGNTVVSTNL